MLIKQISIFVENRPGRLADITAFLADKGIDMRALSLADTTDFGILRIIVKNPDKVFELLRNNKITVSMTDVIAVKLPDKPGALYKMLDVLAKAEISVEYAYAFVSPSNTGSACVVVRTSDTPKAEKVLTDIGYTGVENL